MRLVHYMYLAFSYKFASIAFGAFMSCILAGWLLLLLLAALVCLHLTAVVAPF